MAEYPPYVNAYNGVSTLFQKIKTAAVPPKFTVDFLSTVSFRRACVKLERTVCRALDQGASSV